MRYGSVCSGIEAATVAWHPLGWEPVWFSEIEPFPCKVLKHHYPHVPNLGDMLKLTENETFNNEPIDLLVGGTPCQSFSIAGLRGGLTDDRGNLALEFCRLLIAKRPRWFVWENVPGVHSSFSYEEGSSRVDGKGRDNGREFTETADFASILAAFRECGYSCAWRVLDAQFCGVPQRRRRVFVVGHLGDDWRPSAAVLFEPEGLRRNPPESGEKRKKVTGTVGKSTGGRSIGVEEALGNMLIIPAPSTRPYADNESNEGKLIVHTLRGTGHDASEDGTGRGTPIIPCWWDEGQVSQTLDRVLAKGQMMPEKNRFPVVLTYPFNQITSKENRSNPSVGDPAGTLSKNDNSPPLIGFQISQSGNRMVEKHGTLKSGSRPAHNGVTDGLIVRRLTPLECERLQGFPDYYTNIPGAKDTPRYESIGNSMAVPVMKRIGQRIDHVDKQMKNL